MPRKILLTKEGLEKYQLELKVLQNSLPNILKEVQRTAAMGDRSENAGYQNAKSMLRRSQSRISYLERLLRNAEILRKYKREKIGLGCDVTLEDIQTHKKVTYTLVNSLEVDPKRGYVSPKSPLGSAISGKRIGDIVKVIAHENTFTYKVVAID